MPFTVQRERRISALGLQRKSRELPYGTRLPWTGLALYYHHDNHLLAQPGWECGESDFLRETTLSLRGVARRGSDRVAFEDRFNEMRLEAAEEASGVGVYEARLRVSPIDWKVSLWGIAQRGASALAKSLLPISPIQVAGPDLDLHFFTEDGAHVGVDYSSGQFEVTISGAEATGDQFNGEEWIFVPIDSQPVRVIVSGFDVARYLVEHPEAWSPDGKDTVLLRAKWGGPSQESQVTGPVAVDVPLGGSVEIPVLETPDLLGRVVLGEASITGESLVVALDSYQQLGAFKTTDVYSGLRDKLVAAANAIAEERFRAAANQLEAFRNQLVADQQVMPIVREVLLRDSATLLASLES